MTEGNTHQPGAKAAKYDRQLRLWSGHGQEALEKASILVLSGSATSTETLKNLVLPGINPNFIMKASDHSLLSMETLSNNQISKATFLSPQMISESLEPKS